MILFFTATWGINEIGPITVYILLQQKSATFDGISTKILTDSGPSIKLLIGVLIRDAPDPPNPPNGGAKVFFGGLWLKDLANPHWVKYNWETLDLKYVLGYYWRVPQPLWPLTPLDPYRGAL